MKRTLLATLAVFAASPAFAQTVSEDTAKEMAAVLSAPKIVEYLQQEDGVGNLNAISYEGSNRSAWGPSLYKVTFESQSGMMGKQICTVHASVNMTTHAVMEVDRIAECAEENDLQ